MTSIEVKKTLQVGDVLENKKTKKRIVVREEDLTNIAPDDWTYEGRCFCLGWRR